MKKTKATCKQLQLALCILLIPMLLTGCVKTTPIEIFAQLYVASAVKEAEENYASSYDYGSIHNEASESSSATESSEPSSTQYASSEATSESSEDAPLSSASSETPETNAPSTPETSGTYVADGSYAQTIMIYMVGSDLESEYGNASLDLQEIMDSHADTKHNNIVVYTGGAAKWQIDGLSASENSILLLEEDHSFSIIDSTSADNMGEADTLSYFINYCYDNFESESYSLILWNHGGGPVLGFGVDENYDDLLTMQEMQTAFSDSVGIQGERLEWVGFDACLMNSMEIADMLTPYANYMIASQETEPGWGWSYEFLSQLSNEAMTGAEMGKLIIDYYMLFGNLVFTEYPRMYSDLTLSCIDLNQYQAAEAALNTCFAELDSTLDVYTYRDIVRNRETTRAFGSYSTNFDYCMVDAIHLLEQIASDSASASDAIEAIDNMIVYSQSNMSNACGISICYPYETSDIYTETCIAIQENMDFASNYTGFLRDFHAIESGETLSSGWDFSKSAATVNTIAAEGEDIADTSEITLQLTEEQQANYASAGYYILCNAKGAGYIDADEDPRADEMYIFIHSGKNVELDANGVLHAYYGNSALYMHDKTDGHYSPIPMILLENDSTEAEKRYTCYATMNNWNIAPDVLYWKNESGKLQIVISDEYPNGIIRNVIPLSDDSEIQSASKQLINLDDYGILEISAGCNYVTRDENGQMKGFYDWESSEWMMGFDQDLTHEYCLELQPLENPENYSCMFYIKDTQGNISYSELIPLK